MLFYKWIDDLRPGRDMDALVAERVMGFQWIRAGSNRYLVRPAGKLTPGSRGKTDELADVPKYSTSFAAAWTIVGRLKKEGWSLFTLDDREGEWSASFGRKRSGDLPPSYSPGFGATPSEAICKAADLAVRDWHREKERGEQ